MMIWGLKIAGWLMGNPWTGGLIAGLVAVAIGWHVLTEGSERRAEIAAAVQAEKLAWIEESQKERRRQVEIGLEALDAARKEIARLEAENTALAANQKEWDREADAAPDAADVCLSPDSLQRLNRIR